MKLPNVAVILGHTNPLTDPRVKKSEEALRAAGFMPQYVHLRPGLGKLPKALWFRNQMERIIRFRPTVGPRKALRLISLPFVPLRALLKVLLKAGYKFDRWLKTNFVRSAVQMIKRQRPAIVYGHEHLALEVLNEYQKLSGSDIPFVWDAHEFYPDIQWAQDKARLQFLEALESAQSSIAGFVTVNKYIAKEFQTLFPNLPGAHICSNAAKKIALPAYDGRLHREAELEPDCKILLYQGGLSPFRGVEKLLEVAPRLGPEWAVVFMGSGKLEGLVKENVSPQSDVGRKGLIRLIPPVPHDELPLWTLGATIGAILYEPMNTNQRLCSPNKLWEYSSAGVPIISNDLPFLLETISREGTGWTVNSSADADQIATSIKTKDAEELADMSKRGVKFSNKENWNSEVEKLSGFVKKISPPQKLPARLLRQRAR